MDDNMNPSKTPPKYGKAYLVFHNSSPGVWSWTVAGWLSGGWQRQKTGEPIEADRVFCYRDLPPSPVFPDDFREKPWA